MNVPMPGGSVGPKTFTIYLGGATLGVLAYTSVITNYIPDSWEQKSVGPISGTHVFLGLFGLLGAAAAASVVK